MTSPGLVADFAVTLDADQLGLIRRGAAVVVTSPVVLRVEGPGAVQCLQGLLTNDVVKPGDGSLTWGALLTPRGMIVADLWTARAADACTLVAPAAGHEPALDILRRMLPPRLARLTDLTGTVRAAWVLGPDGFHALVKAGLGPLPGAAGRVSVIDTVRGRLLAALGPDPAPFAALIVGEDAPLGVALDALSAAGAGCAPGRVLEAARILAGWPALGAEMDARTLPQEARFDQIGGVSYTKGCYTGQETVARLHFRGHTNRELRGLRVTGPEPLEDGAVLWGEREVGRIRSTLQLPDRVLALAPLRREVAPGELVRAGGRPATVVPLPFAPAEITA